MSFIMWPHLDLHRFINQAPGPRSGAQGVSPPGLHVSLWSMELTRCPQILLSQYQTRPTKRWLTGSRDHEQVQAIQSGDHSVVVEVLPGNLQGQLLWNTQTHVSVISIGFRWFGINQVLLDPEVSLFITQTERNDSKWKKDEETHNGRHRLRISSLFVISFWKGPNSQKYCSSTVQETQRFCVCRNM